MACWIQLPTEVRLVVLDLLAADTVENHGRSASTNSKSGLACYALVSKEWQIFFEQRIYHRLTLTQHCLDDFESIVHRRRRFVRYIWLRFKLAPYRCSTCDNPRYESSQQREMKGLSNAIAKVFSILNRWESIPESNMDGITLEISVHSPSDVGHSFKGDKYLDANQNEMEDMRPTESRLSDLFHEWSDGRPQRRPSISEVYKRGLGLCKIYEPLQCPVVRAITGLVFRRTTRRYIAAETFENMLQSLPNLRHFTYEIWRQLMRFGEYLWEAKHRKIISTHLPPSLKTLRFFEDFNGDFNLAHFEDTNGTGHVWPPEIIRTPSDRTSSELAVRSLGLQEVSGSYSIDAVPFFRAVEPTWIWDNLTLLSLTCQLFSKTSNYPEIVAFLTDIATIIQRMPKLQLLDIWHGMKHHASAFKYRVTNSQVTIVWCGTWELELTAERSILQAWQEIARLNTRNDLSVGMYQRLDSQDVTSHAAAIRLLGISELVLHPASLEEISRESEFYFYT